jgi:hypothetical protein
MPPGPTSAPFVTASRAPLQAVWVEAAEGVMRWDKPINGIQWFYRPADDAYSYRVASPIGEKYREGENVWRSYDEWHGAGAARVVGIRERVANYEAALGRGGRDLGARDGTVYVEDTLPKKYNFEFKDQKAETHFYNTYAAEVGGEAVMRENYRSPAIGKSIDVGNSFFATDVFFSQLAAVERTVGRATSGDVLEDLPAVPPLTIVRDTIDNPETKELLRSVTDGGQAGIYRFEEDDERFYQILATPNGKATFNLLDDFNFINRNRDLPAYTIVSIEVLKSGVDPDSGWKIKLHLAQA